MSPSGFFGSRTRRELFYALKFALVGLVNTAITAVVMAGLALTGMHDSLYAAIGYLVGMAVSFVLNFRFTFRQKGRDKLVPLVKFVAVGLAMLAVAETVQFVAKSTFGWPEAVGVALGMVAYTGGGFLLNRFWVFQNRSESR